MNETAVLAMAQSMRNAAISLVQQAEAVITLIEGDPEPKGPTCAECQSVDLILTRAGGKSTLVCRNCNHNQPG